jgi:Ferritin-like
VSYFQYPRLTFSGWFQTDPSTVNNDPEHFDSANFRPTYEMPMVGGSADEMNGWWNPKGRAAWRFRDCTVTQVEYTDGTVCTNSVLDPVVGMPINSVIDRVEGKLVDLDPEQQMVSAIWGFQVFLGAKGSSLGFGGDYEVASFGDIWLRFPKGKPDSFFGAYYQSVIALTQQIVNDQAQSKFLEQLKAAIGSTGSTLSIKFNVDGYDDDSTSPTFTFGRITGTIGPHLPGEPRRYSPCRVLQATNPQLNLNTAYALVQGNTLHLDLGNSLPTTAVGGPLLNQGPLVVYTQDASGKLLAIGQVDYAAKGWYERTAGLVSFPLTDALLGCVQTQPLSVVQPNNVTGPVTYLAEAPSGQWVRADQFVFRFNPTASASDSNTAMLYASQRGQPIPQAQISFLLDPSIMQGFIQQVPGGLPGPDVGTPVEGIFVFKDAATGQILPAQTPAGGGQPFYTITADAQGVAKLVIEASNPGNPRGYIDGQVYGLSYQLGPQPPAVGQVQNPSQILNFLVFSAYEIPEQPTWVRDVYPIFLQYAQLYPVMRRIVDLANYGNVMQHVPILKNVFSAPMTDPNYMPVTRDLSAAKQQMILRWLDNPVYMNPGDRNQLMTALQSAIELEHSTIPLYLTALYSLKPNANREVAALIRSVVVEEMLHMALACNILISIGGSPSIGQPGFIPTYPGPLPGGVRPDLVAVLKRASIEQLRDCFMNIEMPEEMLKERLRRLKPRHRQQATADYTIGWFYDQIASSLKLLAGVPVEDGGIAFGNAERQLNTWSNPTELRVVTSLQDALAAIEEIKSQGEGNSKSPIDEDGDLAHYYKFSEIVEGRKLVKTATGWAYTGEVIPFDPDGVYPMIDNPSQVNYPAGSRAALVSAEFAETYQALLSALHVTFNGNPKNITTAIGTMYSLALIADQLMQTPSGLQPGTTAGPQFEVPVS